MIEELAWTYNIPATAVIGKNQAESGVALQIRNQELQDEKLADIKRWRIYEEQIYQIERALAEVAFGISLLGVVYFRCFPINSLGLYPYRYDTLGLT